MGITSHTNDNKNLTGCGISTSNEVSIITVGIIK